jgi:hypothetical protein
MLPPDATAKQRDVRAKRSGLPIVFRCARLDIATGRGRLSRPPRSGMPWPVSGPTSPARLGPWSYLRRYDRGIGGGIAMLIATNVLFLGIPVTTGEVIVALERGDPEHQVVWLCLAMIGFALGTAVTRILSRVWIFNAARAAEYDLRGDLFRHLLTLDGPYHTTHPTGDTMSRLTNDVQTVRAMWGAGVLNIVNTLFAFVTVLTMMLRIDPWLTLWACLPYPTIVLAGRLFGKRIYRSSMGVQAQLGALSNEIQEDLTAIAAIKTYGLEADRRARFVASSRRLLDRNMDLTRLLGGLEAGAAADHGVVEQLDQAAIDGGEPVAGGPDRGDAGEQRAVEAELAIAGLGEARRPRLLDCLDRGVVLVARQDREQGLGSSQVAAGVLEGQDGVGEARRRRLGGDHRQLGLAQRDRGGERSRKAGGGDPLPRRHAAVGPRPWRQDRIGVGQGGQAGDLGLRHGVGRRRHRARVYRAGRRGVTRGPPPTAPRAERNRLRERMTWARAGPNVRACEPRTSSLGWSRSTWR